MDNLGVKDVKNKYIDILINKGNINKAERILLSSDTDPIYNGYVVNPDDEPNVNDITDMICDITLDMAALSDQMELSMRNFLNLMYTAQNKLDSISEKIESEKDRIKDMNIICGNYDEFTSIKTIKAKDLTGVFGNDNDTIFCKKKEEIKAEISVLQIMGNGYEGNAYVLSDEYSLDDYGEKIYQYKNDTDDTSIREYMIDSSSQSFYEYSRLNSTEETGVLPKDVNFDNKPVQCGIIYFFDKEVNYIKILSNQKNIAIKDILTSADHGATFQSCHENKDPIKINDTDSKYTSVNYTTGSNIISFPKTQYLKLILENDESTNDRIGFTATDIVESNKYVEIQKILENTRRRCIRINGVSSTADTYVEECTFYVGDLISTPVKSIAIFANEYIPPYYKDSMQYIRYNLTVNGTTYEMVPINRLSGGTKIIRNAAYSIVDSYVKGIHEDIKSASLSITISSIDGVSTPYINNLKICLGKVGDI